MGMVGIKLYLSTTNLKKIQPMLVKTTDLISFTRKKIDFFEEAIIRRDTSYSEKKNEYENTFFHKLFGMKYEKSSCGNSWNYWQEYKLTEYNDEMNRLAYAYKIGHKTVELLLAKDEFYDYAKKLNLPD